MVVNHTAPCEGELSRIQEYEDGTQVGTTIDYAFVSPSLEGQVIKMKFGDRMGSDHKLITLHLDLEPEIKDTEKHKETWRLENIPQTEEEMKKIVGMFQHSMSEWITDSSAQITLMEAAEVDTKRAADILDWSFQTRLDEVCHEFLGTKKVKAKPTPMLDEAMRLLETQRKISENMLQNTMKSKSSTKKDRIKAIRIYREAKKRLISATKRRKALLELQLFHQIEDAQADPKLFWARAKRLTNRLTRTAAPPPMVQNKDGVIESDPVEVLKTWRKYSATIADNTPKEEEIYDDSHHRYIEERLRRLNMVRLHQDGLDDPISEDEIWGAIKRMRPGKAPGIDGILSTILKIAADEYNIKKGKQKRKQKNKKKKKNTVISALFLLFNYVFANEVWPERWGSGIIFPLYKSGNRMNPGNYRPITLLSVVGKLFGSIIERRLTTWSESTQAFADEQGGFRRTRGTSDQIFILREVIASRKERGLPTLATFIDARKAYDTVWREGNYVRLHNKGVKGKLWRQIQIMGNNMRSKIRLPFGDTDWFDVKKGVAQGAVESPWLYSNFINGLAEELKLQNFGVLVGDTRIPLLMYADDIVLLASTPTELQEMNEIASEYAYKNRYQYNGAKSAVMVFNATPELRRRMKRQLWTLSGEEVNITDEYRYLGVDLTTNITNWRQHMRRILDKARYRSNELLWMCRRDSGIRPRSAMTLWKSLVRPILEYACEIWAGEIPNNIINEAERLQTNFAKAILGLTGHRAISNDFIRSELGLEKLEARWEKARLSFWRRLWLSDPDRILFKIATLRKDQIRDNDPNANDNWMRGMRDLLQNRSLADAWNDVNECTKISKQAWREIMHNKIETHFETLRKARMENMPTMAMYKTIKHWSWVGAERAVLKGEAKLRGAMVSEPYLDDHQETMGRKLKLLCRANCLPLLPLIAHERGWDPSWTKCLMCNSNSPETLHHVLLDCSAYNTDRARILSKVTEIHDKNRRGRRWNSLQHNEKVQILLGQRVYSSKAEKEIDHFSKRLLHRIWRKRKHLTRTLNAEFERQDILTQ